MIFSMTLYFVIALPPLNKYVINCKSQKIHFTFWPFLTYFIDYNRANLQILVTIWNISISSHLIIDCKKDHIVQL